ncbi:hypothetical protein B0H14DRAFT_2744466 [Mycena olivaceomarginata]|nr:hypothetical protein B0H14DRAFT_2744466 [Mycena olivaceomarginata]
MTRFGDFDTLCRDTPSYTCMVFTAVLIWVTNKRKAAVGRIELRTFLSLYFLTLPLQLVTTGSFLEQGGTPLVVITAIHAASSPHSSGRYSPTRSSRRRSSKTAHPPALSLSTRSPSYFFAATTYISLDIGLSITSVFGPSTAAAKPGEHPAVSATVVIYFALMTYIVLAVLNEVRPMWFYILSAALFVLSQLDYFLLNKVICKVRLEPKVDGSFVATFLETAAVGVLYLAWKSITEESWDEDAYYPS